MGPTFLVEMCIDYMSHVSLRLALLGTHQGMVYALGMSPGHQFQFLICTMCSMSHVGTLPVSLLHQKCQQVMWTVIRKGEQHIFEHHLIGIMVWLIFWQITWWFGGSHPTPPQPPNLVLHLPLLWASG